MLIRCRTDFADIQNKKECGGNLSLIHIWIRSTNFLHNMARLIIGTLIDIGMGKRSPKDITAIFSGRLLPSAPCDPKGLILEDVSYN